MHTAVCVETLRLAIVQMLCTTLSHSVGLIKRLVDIHCPCGQCHSRLYPGESEVFVCEKQNRHQLGQRCIKLLKVASAARYAPWLHGYIK